MLGYVGLALLIATTMVTAGSGPPAQQMELVGTVPLPLEGNTDGDPVQINGSVQLLTEDNETQSQEVLVFEGKEFQRFSSEAVFSPTGLLDFLGIEKNVDEFDRCHIVAIAFNGRGALNRELVYERSGFDPVIEDTGEIIFVRDAKFRDVRTVNITTDTLTISSEERADDLQFRLTLEGGSGGEIEFRSQCFQTQD